MTQLVFPKTEKFDDARKRRTEQLYSYLKEKNDPKASAGVIKHWLKEGIYTGLRDTDQCTLLHLAAQRQKMTIVSHLLDMGEDVDALDDRHETPLWKASQNNNNNEVVMELLSRGAQVDIHNKLGVPLIFSTHNPRILKSLIKGGAPIERRGLRNRTLLHRYSSHTAIKMPPDKKAQETTVEDKLCAILLEYGANVNNEDDDGKTILQDEQLDRLANTHTHDKIKSANQFYAEFAQQGTAPVDIHQIYNLLMVWPRSNPRMEADRVGHIRQIFTHAKWPSTAAAEQIAQGLLEDKQINISQHKSLIEAAFPTNDRRYAISTPSRERSAV